MDEFKKFLRKTVTPFGAISTYTFLAARDLEFFFNGKNISLENEPFFFALILFLFAVIPLILVIGSSALYIDCNSTKNNWLSRKSKEIAASYAKGRIEAEEYNS